MTLSLIDRPSPNFNERAGVAGPDILLLHYTGMQSCEAAVTRLTDAATKVSSHYTIDEDGTVYVHVPENLRAWHAGAAKWGNSTDINSNSIGIEIDNNGFEMFTEQQVNSLLRLLTILKKDYNIPTANFIGHADIAPGRKIDPNRNFPWQRLATDGFGLWYDTTAAAPLPENFNALQALRIVGYNISDSSAAIYSFKLHFVQADSSKTFTDADKKILFDLQCL